MNELVKTIALTSSWILDLLFKHNEMIYVEVDENDHPVIKSDERDHYRYVSIYQNDGRPTLILHIMKVKTYKFKDLLKELETEPDVFYEVDNCGIRAVRSGFDKEWKGYK